MKRTQPLNQNHRHTTDEGGAEKTSDLFYPFDMSVGITSLEADDVEAYYANRYKWQ